MAAITGCPSSKRHAARGEEDDQDRINCLPVDLIERILCHLPLREAVRTSILSKRWRYIWTTITELVFDERCTPPPARRRSTTKKRLAKIIDSVLLLHRGPITKFKLSHEMFGDTSDIYRWMLYLSSLSMTDLTLQFDYVDPCNIPSCLFHCRHLVRLDLSYCSLKVPPAFQGFENLETLLLNDVDMTRDSLEELISSCPRLRKLNLFLPDDSTDLTIDAPNLQNLVIYGLLEDIRFGRNSLTWVEIGLFSTDYEHAQANEYPNNLEQFTAHLPLIRSLSIEENALKYLSAGNIPPMLPNPLLSLEFIHFSMDPRNLRDVLPALCLLRSSPNLKQIVFGIGSEVDVADEDKIGDCSEIYCSSCSLDALRTIRVFDAKDREQEMSLLKFLLLNSPVLETFQVWASPSGSDVIRADKLLEELDQSQRASVQADIVVFSR